eukprot:gnl/TRDRNA2_/TRDRNA2_176855_c7_seq20.p1 gnl/TRDRNA2_/TRDRNA2_176855_c7~~gnl/TRDRNA2_/TRDRNA2_176855_c7_seq20.p1  ORF type:complete len:229 (+),score=44.60 gnl/TRDRNA2_/TRDRNA2_176855_c7_seq20:1147-1833(+)
MSLTMGWKSGLLSPETVIWVCALAINQNADIGGTLGGDVLQSPFAKVLMTCGKVVTLFNLSMDLHTRVWCVLEAYLMTKKAQDTPSFKIEAIGIQGRGQAMDAEWIQMNFPNQLAEAKAGMRNMEEFLDGGSKLATYDHEKEVTLIAEGTSDLISYAIIWATKFVEENPRHVSDAKASVEQDRIDIMKVIAPMQETVDEMVKQQRIEKMASSILAILFFRVGKPTEEC